MIGDINITIILIMNFLELCFEWFVFDIFCLESLNYFKGYYLITYNSRIMVNELDVTGFITNNPYQEPKEIATFKKAVVEFGFTESNVAKFYWEEMVKIAYKNLDDNEAITLAGLKMKFIRGYRKRLKQKNT